MDRFAFHAESFDRQPLAVSSNRLCIDGDGRISISLDLPTQAHVHATILVWDLADGLHLPDRRIGDANTYVRIFKEYLLIDRGDIRTTG